MEKETMTEVREAERTQSEKKKEEENETQQRGRKIKEGHK
jgi:hypothetical protein